MSIVAVTGATGFVGREFVRQLDKQHLIPRLLVRSPSRLKEMAKHAHIIGDLGDLKALKKLCRGADVLVHIAGRITARNPEEFTHANVEGTQNITRIAVKAGVQKIILISSLAARASDLTAYAASKRAGEEALISNCGDIPFVILRPPAVYGPGDAGTFPLLKALTQRYAVIPGQKHSRISIIHVHDLARAMIGLLTAPDDKINRQIFELHDGRKNGYSWPEMAHMAGLVENKAVECVFLPRSIINIMALCSMLYAKALGKVPFLSLDKVQELYHKDWICRHNLLNETDLWEAGIGFKDGFQETIKWYRVNGWLS